MVARPAGAAARDAGRGGGADLGRRRECVAIRGMVIHTATQRKLTYGELAAKAATDAGTQGRGAQETRRVQARRALDPAPDTPSKVNGSAVFGIDVRVPDMLRAMVVRSPVIGGKVVSFDAASAKSVKGVATRCRSSSALRWSQTLLDREERRRRAQGGVGRRSLRQAQQRR